MSCYTDDRLRRYTLTLPHRWSDAKERNWVATQMIGCEGRPLGCHTGDRFRDGTQLDRDKDEFVLNEHNQIATTMIGCKGAQLDRPHK